MYKCIIMVSGATLSLSVCMTNLRSPLHYYAPSTTNHHRLLLYWSNHLQCWYNDDYKMESQCTCIFFGHDTKHLSCKFFGRKQWYQSGQQRAKKLHFPKWTAKSSGKSFCCLCSRSSSFSWPKKLKKLQEPTMLSKIGTSAFRLWLLLPPLKLDYYNCQQLFFSMWFSTFFSTFENHCRFAWYSALFNLKCIARRCN